MDLPDCPMYAVLQVLHFNSYIPLGYFGSVSQLIAGMLCLWHVGLFLGWIGFVYKFCLVTASVVEQSTVESHVVNTDFCVRWFCLKSHTKLITIAFHKK